MSAGVHYTEFILRLYARTWSDEEEDLEKLLTATAKARRGKLSKIVREEFEDHAMHVSRKTLVRRR